MPRPRLAMRKVRDVLRLTLGQGMSRRQAATATGVPLTTVVDCLSRAAAAALQWPLPEGMDDAELEGRLYPGAPANPRQRPEPDWATVHTELRRKDVTLQLLWIEYQQSVSGGYQYTQCATRSRARLCQTTQSHRRTMQGSDLGFCPLTLPGHATGAIPWCEASGTTSISPVGAAVEPRGEAVTASTKVVGGGVDGMASQRKPLLHAVILNAPKVLGRCGRRRGSRPDRGRLTTLTQTVWSPAERRGLTHQGTRAERGKPVSLPSGKASRKASRQGCGYRIAEDANAAV